MILYHGTLDRYAYDIFTNGIDLNKSKDLLDFGKGFYTSPDKGLAIDTAIRRAKRNNQFLTNPHAKPYIVKMKIDDSIFSTVNIKKFESIDDDWATFIINNRCELSFIKSKNIVYHNHNLEYDIVIGATADGTVSNIAYEVTNNITKVESGIYKKFLTKDKKDLGTQISFHSEKIISCIEVIECGIINLNERR